MSDENNKEFNLSVDSNIMEVIQRYPQATEIFMKSGLPCVGCAAAQYEKISDVVAEFGIDAEDLIKQIKDSAKEDK
jgi:hybrid cluster-associated redox disulfide protein